MTTITDWMPIDFDIASLKRKIRIHGRDIEVAVSPYDIPAAFRVSTDQTLLRLRIEFSYISKEEKTSVQYLPEDVTVTLGNISNRLYSVDFSVQQDLKALPGRIAQAAQVVGQYARGSKLSNSQMVQRAIATHAPEVELAF